ncbi:MAG: translation factor [Zetaproteobacteria bacterium CG_4_9_14_3_um_filter_54_145]|nr:MAG: translation factor [Zetaproteobacteria bacterium CG_4_10_14_3_um_filter_54_28]PJA29172.1 MAG: translation factor [Zetaproteobacteria bacterium CG_4_9_14_3_um_filter_54_145]
MQSSPGSYWQIAAHRLRQYSLNSPCTAATGRHLSITCLKLAALRAARLLGNDGVIAHHTATLPGVAAAANNRKAAARLVHFKQRRGPFLLLADHAATAARLVRYFSPALRRQMRSVWPGPVTLVFPARPGLPACCYHKGLVALRVDGSLQTRQLARTCGGLLLSSSLNRRGKTARQPDISAHLRLHRYLAGRIQGAPSAGKASSIVRIRGNHSTVIRR